MAKATSSGVLDGLLDAIAAAATGMSLCAGQPANAAAASSGIAVTTMTTGAGDFTKTGASSRVMQVAAKAGVAISTTAVADHVALFSTVANVLYFVTTMSSQALSSGGTVNISTWSISVEQPV